MEFGFYPEQWPYALISFVIGILFLIASRKTK